MRVRRWALVRAACMGTLRGRVGVSGREGVCRCACGCEEGRGGDTHARARTHTHKHTLLVRADFVDGRSESVRLGHTRAHTHTHAHTHAHTHTAATGTSRSRGTSRGWGAPSSSPTRSVRVNPSQSESVRVSPSRSKQSESVTVGAIQSESSQSESARVAQITSSGWTRTGSGRLSSHVPWPMPACALRHCRRRCRGGGASVRAWRGGGGGGGGRCCGRRSCGRCCLTCRRRPSPSTPSAAGPARTWPASSPPVGVLCVCVCVCVLGGSLLVAVCHRYRLVCETRMSALG